MVARGKQWIGVVVIVVILIAGVAVWLRPWQRSANQVTLPLLEQAISVLAITENGRDFREAISGWSELLEARPDDRALLLNQAVTVLKWISNTNSELTSGSITDPQKERELALELQEAYAEADRILKRLAESNAPEQTADGQQALLESALLDARARVLPYPDDIELRKSAAEKLLTALQQAPQQPLLAVRLFDLAQELQSDWPEVVPRATDAIFEAWRAQPRNLYLLVRTGESLLAQKDKRILEVLDASVQLAQPLLSMLPGANQLKPAELVADVHAAVAADDWAKAQRVRAWLNVLRASSAFRADNRLVNPDILALLNTSFLQRWRLLLPEHVRRQQRPDGIQITSQTLPNSAPGEKDTASDDALLVAWYDFDVDRDFDILAVRAGKLRITPWDAAGPATQSVDVELPLSARGLCIADLWTVDSPERPRKSTPAPDSQAASTVDSNAHDTLQEVILWDAERCVVLTRGSEPVAEHSILKEVPGLSSIAGIRHMVPLDLDSDGDLDLAIGTASGVQFLQNNGNRTFEDITRYSLLAPNDWHANRLIACDFDRDLDLDLIACSTTAPHWAVFENILHSQFRFRELNEPSWRGEVGLNDAAVLEFDGNASWDWCGVGQAKLCGVATRTTAPGAIVPETRFDQELKADRDFERLRVADVNQDGHPDLCLSGRSGIEFFLSDGTSLDAEPSNELFGRPVTQCEIQDADYNGTLEMLSVDSGQINLHRLQPKGSDHHHLDVRVRGIADVNGGGRINHYAIGSVLELWSSGHYQAQVIQSPLTHFGLPSSQADNLRIIFNNGLTQNALEPAADTLLEERQELRGSCPFVYGWNGERFELITDLLWNAPLGLQVARGSVLPDRRWENLLLPGNLVQPHDGAIELRVTEELWEVAYFDHATLTAIDHPADIEVWTNEKVGPPQLAEPRLFLASRPIRPLSARDGKGRDVASKLAARDRKYVQAFDQQICQGLCEPHSIELAFDRREVLARSDLRLVLTGWMYPTDTSLNIGIAQNENLVAPQPPSLWVPNERGEFVCAQPFMGFPGGKPKTIVVDLNGVFTNQDTRLRINSSQQIYWDEAYIIADEPPAPLRIEPLELQNAELQYRGFSRLMPRKRDQPHWYDYTQVDTAPKWPPLEGPYTRYGSVLRQIQADDDRIVVMASGDEMTLRFALPSKPLPPGWQRDYVLHSVGWDKDSDINTLEGQSSLPLPFAGMRSYPPTYEQAEESERVWQLNVDSLIERSSFNDFWRTQ